MSTLDIILTPKALEKIKEIISKQPSPGKGLRIAVVGGGCSGFQYQMRLENEPTAEDLILEKDGLKIFLDPRSALYLDGVTIDYVESLEGTGFKFHNPKATGTCGCGESFNV